MVEHAALRPRGSREESMSYGNLSRRHFFFGSLLAGAVPIAGYGSVPSLRALGYKPFYEKLNVASVGCGGQGGRGLNNPPPPGNNVAPRPLDEVPSAPDFQKIQKAAQA